MTPSCFWCKALVGAGGCRCVGYGRHRFHWGVAIARKAKRIGVELPSFVLFTWLPIRLRPHVPLQ